MRPRLFERFATGRAPGWHRARALHRPRAGPRPRRRRLLRAVARPSSRPASSSSACRSGRSRSGPTADDRLGFGRADPSPPGGRRRGRPPAGPHRPAFPRRLRGRGEAADGAEAVRLAAQLQPDVVVLDLGLPDLAGREVLSRHPAALATHQGGGVLGHRDRGPGLDRGTTSRASCSRTPSSTTWSSCSSPSGGCDGADAALDLPHDLSERARRAAVREREAARRGISSRSSTTRCWSSASWPPTR